MDFYQFLAKASQGDVPRVYLPGGQTEGRVVANENDNPPERLHVMPLGSHYASKYREEDAEEEVEQMLDINEQAQTGNIDDLTSIGTIPNVNRDLNQQLTYIYQNYSFTNFTGNPLSIHAHKRQILELIDSNPVIIINGQTGCGKSTQVPQFILDSSREMNIHCNIVVTQPRRIAAKSLAKRVCQERSWSLGSIVGYQVGLEKNISPDTRLLYCTAGTLLQKIISQRSLTDYTHIIIDEIHERDSDTDFLLVVLKQMMRNPNNRVKLILMSATISSNKFVEYFTKKCANGYIEPLVKDIASRTNYPVHVYDWDSIMSRIPYKGTMVFKQDEPMIKEQMYVIVSILIGIFKSIDENENRTEAFIGSVLIFLPGLVEIEHMHKVLTDKINEGGLNEQWLLCPLHSSITFDEQMRVFAPAPAKTRKIILATNIAESSITVPDVKYVIDFCLCKLQVLERDTGYSSLALRWISQSQGTQRAGRVGRVMPGRIYRLVPDAFYNEFEIDQDPEILRCPLDTLVLKAKLLNMGDPVGILGRCIDPPDLSNVRLTILKLKEVGALKFLTNGQYDEEDGDLTFMGRVMGSLPLDIHLSKLIIMGYLFGCLQQCIVMACSMAAKSMFATPFKQRLEAYQSKLSWSDASCSDPMTYLTTYSLWKHKTSLGMFKRSGGEREDDWAARRFVQAKSLREVQKLELEIEQRLRNLGIQDDGGHTIRSIPEVTEEFIPLLLKIALAGAAYPNYFVQGSCDEKEAVRTLGGRDPFTTVYLTKWPVDQPGPLYMNTIKKYFEDCGSEMTVGFDGSAKVYINFGSSASAHNRSFRTNQKDLALPGKVAASVYRAIKMRHMNIPISIPLLRPVDAKEAARQIFGDVINKYLMCWSSGQIPKQLKQPRTRMPGIEASLMSVTVSHIDDPSSFWVQVADEASTNKLVWIIRELNRVPLKSLRGNKLVHVGQRVVAPFDEGGQRLYYRACVVAVTKDRGDGEIVVQYIDYGNTHTHSLSVIYDYNDELIDVKNEPALAFHCYLAEVRPSVVNNEKAIWSKNANEAFLKRFRDRNATISIYSVVNDMVAVHLYEANVELKSQDGRVCRDDSFNYYLINKEWAIPVDESLLSRENHMIRESTLKKTASFQPISALTADSDAYFRDFEFESPGERDRNIARTAVLLGPKSPLEVKVTCLTRKCGGKEAGIESNSVNSVLLDHSPMDHCTKLVIAQIVTQGNQTDRLTLRETTVMPQIHGILGIVSMIFAPRIELRTDNERSFITGALCGLGFDRKTGSSYFPENDMDIEFDVEFDHDDDVMKINKIRYWINRTVGNEAATNPTISAPTIANARKSIVGHLYDLLRKKRHSLEASRHAKAYRWGCIKDEMPPLRNEQHCEQDRLHSTFPLIWGIVLEGGWAKRSSFMRTHLNHLDNIVQGKEKVPHILKCELCQMYMDNLQNLQFHLSTTVHRFNLEQFLDNCKEQKNQN